MSPYPKRKLQAQRKFAQGAYIPLNINAAPVKGDPPAPAKDRRSIIHNNLSAKSLLDIVSFQNSHVHFMPVVVLMRLNDSAEPSAPPTRQETPKNKVKPRVSTKIASKKTPKSSPKNIAKTQKHVNNTRGRQITKQKTRKLKLGKLKVKNTMRLRSRKNSFRKRSISATDTEDDTPLKYLRLMREEALSASTSPGDSNKTVAVASTSKDFPALFEVHKVRQVTRITKKLLNGKPAAKAKDGGRIITRSLNAKIEKRKNIAKPKNNAPLSSLINKGPSKNGAVTNTNEVIDQPAAKKTRGVEKNPEPATEMFKEPAIPARFCKQLQGNLNKTVAVASTSKNFPAPVANRTGNLNKTVAVASTSKNFPAPVANRTGNSNKTVAVASTSKDFPALFEVRKVQPQNNKTRQYYGSRGITRWLHTNNDETRSTTGKSAMSTSEAAPVLPVPPGREPSVARTASPCPSESLTTFDQVVSACPTLMSKRCQNCEQCTRVSMVEEISDLIHNSRGAEDHPNGNVYDFDPNENAPTPQPLSFNRRRPQTPEQNQDINVPGAETPITHLYLDLYKQSPHIIEITCVLVPNTTQRMMSARLIPKSEAQNAEDFNFVKHHIILQDLLQLFKGNDDRNQQAEASQGTEDNREQEAEVHQDTEDNIDQESELYQDSEDNKEIEIDIHDDTEDNREFLRLAEDYQDTENNKEQEAEVHQDTEDNREQEAEVHQDTEDNREQEAEVHQETEDNREQEAEVHQDTEDNREQEAETDEYTEYYSAQEAEADQDTVDNTEQEAGPSNRAVRDRQAKEPSTKPVEKPAKLVEAPVFYPTEEEFNDPISFFEKISPMAAKYGLCKVVAPKSFKPTCSLNDALKFNVTNHYITRLFSRWGSAAREISAMRAYLGTQNINFNRVPLLDSLEVNLPKLYSVVQRNGGLEQVLEKKRWGRVAEEMRFSKGPNTEKTLDNYYVKYLLPYDTASNQERMTIMGEVEKCWIKKHGKLVAWASNPLHHQKKLLGESDSSDDESGDEPDAMYALHEAEDCVVAGRPMQLSGFKKVAAHAMKMYMRKGATTEEIEREYWRIVLLGTEHVCVNAASIDTAASGYGFSRNKEDREFKHPWNLKNLSSNTNNVLRSLNAVLGVTVPTLHLGMAFSTCCWHRDPHGLPWMEYMHEGPPKIWYGIPDEQSNNFRRAVEVLCPTSCQNKSIWLSSDITMIPPNLLREHKVSLSRTVQNPGEFIIVFPKSYSCSISTGFTVSESVYFATNSWLITVHQVFQELRSSCEPTTFSLEQLLIALAKDPRSTFGVLHTVHSSLITIVDEERRHRKALKARGVKVRVRNKAKKRKNGATWNVREQDECKICRSTLYLSKVTGIFSKKTNLCLMHAIRALEIRNCSKAERASVEMILFYTEQQLSEIMETLQKRLFNE